MAQDREPNNTFWAKSYGDGSVYHPLISHSADVAAVMRALILPGSATHDRLMGSARCTDSPDGLVATLVYLAGLHDIGKASNGFQDKAGPHRRSGPQPWCNSGHVRPLIDSVSARAVPPELLDAIVRGLPWDQEELIGMVFTTLAHHGRPDHPGQRPQRYGSSELRHLWQTDGRTGRQPISEIQRVAAHARSWAGVPEEGWRTKPFEWTSDLSHLFAGILVAADWIGSSPAIFPLRPEADEDPHAYWRTACLRAADAVAEIGVRPKGKVVGVRGADFYSDAFPSVFTGTAQPTPLQLYMVEKPLPPPGSRVVVESETGSGKTEAILSLYARLRRAGRVDGLVFALPTRATATAMEARLRACLPHLYLNGEAPVVSLAMGGDSRRVTEPVNGGKTYEEPEDEDLRQWSSESAKRFFAAEIVVGTVDQVLLAGLPVKHSHLRLGLLARHLIVVDELHSFDRYMGTVLASVVDLHCRAGGVASFLSATLSRGARLRLTGDEDRSALDEAVGAPFPSVSVHHEGTWNQEAVGDADRAVTYNWRMVSWEEGLGQALALARDGARVCILRNTVKDALSTAAELSGRAPELLWRPGDAKWGVPVHSRYIGPDRKVLDGALLRDFGSGGASKGTIVISTQIIEQSLDVDFDWMLSDLAPIDVLLQRGGRVHRHARLDRPLSCGEATIWVHGPVDGFDPAQERGPHGWGTVYQNFIDLELTRRTVASTPDVRLPWMSRELIESVFHLDARTMLVEREPEWEQAEISEAGRALGQDIHALAQRLPFGEPYPELAHRYDRTAEEKVRTRLGDDRIDVALDVPVRGWYETDATEDHVALPLNLLARAKVDHTDDPVANAVGEGEDGVVYRLGKLELRYGRHGWVW